MRCARRGRARPALCFPANARYRENRLLGPLWEGAPAAAGGGENFAAIRNISGYGKVLSLRPCGATSLAEGGEGLFFTLSTIFCLKIFTKNPKKLFKFPQQCGKVVSNRRECSKITVPQ